MEAVKTVNEHFLTCSLCTGTFKDPCTLKCGHTFCFHCLSQYLKTRKDAVETKSIPCPSCLQVSKATDATKPLDDWPRQFKAHFLIQGFIDTIGDSEVIDEGKHGSRMSVCQEHQCPLEYCCNDCNKAACQKCCIIYHRKCDSVVAIESMMTQMTSVVEEKKHEIIAAMKELKISIETHQSVVNVSSASKETTDVDETTEKHLEEQRGQMKSRELDLQMYEHYSVFIDQALESHSQTDLYHLYQMCKSSDQLNVSMGKLGMQQIDVDLTKQPTLIETTDLNTSEVLKCPNPVDVTIINLDDGYVMVVADFNNNCLRSFFKSGSIWQSSTLRLTDSPQNIIQISSNHVLVSCKALNEITKVQVTATNVETISSITTKKKYRSLARLDSASLVAGCEDPPSIDLIDLSGNWFKTVATGREFGRQLQMPWFLCITKEGSILVSDAGSSTVFSMTQNGEFLFSYPMQHPRGLALSNRGEILVVPFGQPKISLLTKEGKLVKNILTSGCLVSPNGICLYQDRLFVTEFRDGKVKEFAFY